MSPTEGTDCERGIYDGGFSRMVVLTCKPAESIRIGASAEVEQALHEWLGLAWYRLRGRI